MATPIFTQAYLDALIEAYASGEVAVKHGDYAVTFASEADLLARIKAVRRDLAVATRGPSHSLLAHRRGR